jgi:hypothetical protein
MILPMNDEPGHTITFIELNQGGFITVYIMNKLICICYEWSLRSPQDILGSAGYNT